MSATAFCRAMFEFDEPMIWDGERLTHSLPGRHERNVSLADGQVVGGLRQDSALRPYDEQCRSPSSCRLFTLAR
jgi:hypothetical protein